MAIVARRWMILALAVGSLAAFAITSTRLSVSAPAAGAAHKVRTEARGLDRCQAPSHHQMRAFWHDTRWWWFAIYVGGRSMACANRNVTAKWIHREVRRGWGLLPVWVGPQAPCTAYQHTFSNHRKRAFRQGKRVANHAAVHTHRDLNMRHRFPIVYDLEAFNTNNDRCVRATKAFVRGWVTRLHARPHHHSPRRAGVYGSVCGSRLRALWRLRPNPDFIWGAQYSSPPDPDVRHMSCVGRHMWRHKGFHRHKQFRADVSIRENGVRMRVDVNCSRGPTYGRSDPPSVGACGG